MDAEEFQVKPCIIRLKNDKEEYAKLKSKPVSKTSLTKEQKHLLLPTKKKSNKQAKTPAKSRGKNKKSDGKFQLKISSFLSPPPKKNDIKKEEKDDNNEKDEDHEDRSTPDSGIGNSRSVTPSDSSSRSETPSDPKEEDTETEGEVDTDEGVEEEMEKEKEKFLDDLEEDSEESEDDDDDDDWNGSDDDDAFKKKKVVRKPAKTKGRKACIPIIIPGAMKSELSEYEKVRENNIKEREAMLQALMNDFDQYKKDTGITKTAKPVQRRKNKNKDGAFR